MGINNKMSPLENDERWWNLSLGEIKQDEVAQSVQDHICLLFQENHHMVQNNLWTGCSPAEVSHSRVKPLPSILQRALWQPDNMNRLMLR